MRGPWKLLLLEASEADAALVLRALERCDHRVEIKRVGTLEGLAEALGGPCDLVLSELPGVLEALALVQVKDPDLPFLLVSGAQPGELVTEAMRAGARDFISKAGLARLAPAVGREIREASLRRERRRVQLQLRESERRHAGLFQENPVPMLLIDAPTLLVVDANPAAAAFFGYPLETLKQVAIPALSSFSRTGSWKSLQRTKDQRGFLFSDQVRVADGSLRVVDVYAVRIRQAGRALLLATIFDQTDRKEAEEGMARLAAAVEQVADAIAITDAAGVVLYANHAFECLTGLTTAGIRGSLLRDLLGQNGGVGEALSRATEGHSWEGRLAFRTDAGQVRDVDATFSPVRDGDGSVLNLVAVMRDITREVELERQLRQAQKMDALGTLAAGIAHDFNNVLTTILSAAELLKWNLAADSPLLPKVDAILHAGLCASGLNKQILAFSHRSEERRVPLDLTALVQDTLHMLRTTLPANIQIRSHVMSGVWVESDPPQLRQMILNLAINAFHAMRPQGGLLEVSLSETTVKADSPPLGLPEGRYAALQIRDTGCGMDAKTLEHIFEPFFTTKPAGEGTGLGLSMAHATVTKSGGRISVSSEPGHGTTFHIQLPCVTGRELPSGHEAPEDVGGHERILFVDDEEVLAALAKQGLQNLGYQVTVRTNPLEALEDIRLHPEAHDLVFTDLAMPEMNGAELAGRIQAIRPDLPVLLVSGLSPATALPLTAHGSFQGFLAKPFTALDLAKAARQALAAGTGEPRPPQGIRRKAGAPILLAEDSQVTRAMIRTWLERAGYLVQEARDGQEAWELFSCDASGYSLLLTDVVMPRMDGLELAERVRRADPAVPIAVLTSNEDRETVKVALNLGVNEFLNKPFGVVELLKSVERLLAERSSRLDAQRSLETAQAVRLAQRTLVAVPEKDLPLYSLYEPLTDAGGDVFRCLKWGEDSILFILADVAGHSVISSYAVASFLAMLSTFLGECRIQGQVQDLERAMEEGNSLYFHVCMLCGRIPCAPLRHLAWKINHGIQAGPFSEVPVCALMGLWTPGTGRLHLLNAGIPHGLLSRRSGRSTVPIEINGTPLGIFPEPVVEERVIHLERGDRLLFGTDGFFDVLSSDRRLFQDVVPVHWSGLRDTPMDTALSAICEASRSHGDGMIADDLLVVGFEQPALEPAAQGLRLRIPSTPQAIDTACEGLSRFLDAVPPDVPVSPERRFDILLAVREALTNAVLHGNQGRAETFVDVRGRLDPPNLVVSVTDEGTGFDLAAHSPPEDPLSERGRGIQLIHHHAQNVRIVGGELTMTFTLEDSHDEQQVTAASEEKR